MAGQGQERYDETGSTGDGGGLGIPSWIWNPQEKVLSIVTGWLAKRLIKGMLTGSSFALAAIYQPFEIGASTVVELADIAVDGTRPAAASFISIINGINQSMAAAVATTGIAAPVVIWVIQVIELVVLLWLAREAIRSIKPLILSFNPL
jgi:glycerol kinase